ncbi:hypothetical protein ElyMa_004521800 [Elysia marginata]|uniref:Uncharacterized protein n=1 Tax=Elysia marginata TaxID=1093978 RepID=A0AAV4HP00_9GAST|nr:hypothetical protein ElyMa_004521800 [Elysia marginata]
MTSRSSSKHSALYLGVVGSIPDSANRRLVLGKGCPYTLPRLSQAFNDYRALGSGDMPDCQAASLHVKRALVDWLALVRRGTHVKRSENFTELGAM